MTNKTESDNPLLVRSRTDRGQLERAIHALGPDVPAVLRMGPARVEALTDTTIAAAGALPNGRFSPQRKAQLRPLEGKVTPGGLRNLAVLLEGGRNALGPGLPTPAVVNVLAQSITGYEAARAQAAYGVTLVKDLRALVSAYVWLVIKTALAEAGERIADPATSRADRQLYREKLSSLWAHQEELLRAQAEGKAAAQATREQAAAEAEQLRREAVVIDVATAIENGWPVDRESLSAAAKYHKEAEARRQSR